MPLAIATGLTAIIGWLLFVTNRRSFRWTSPEPAPDVVEEAVTRTTISIPTPSGDHIEGWLYFPGASAPVVVMAPGLCGTKEGPLERFAMAFAKAGLCVVSFDFRSFGGSEGFPRHSIDPRDHVADFVSVVDHVRGGLSGQVDTRRIALWGTSFSAASALCASAGMADPPAALILHVPYLGRPARSPGRLQLAGYVGLTIVEMAGDWLAGRFGVKLPPVYITAYGKPGERAFGASKDCPSRHGRPSSHPFWKVLPKTYRGGWRNLCLVRGLQHLDTIDPARSLTTCDVSTLIIAATGDDMVQIADTRNLCAAANNERVELVEIQCAHFDPYVVPHFEPNVSRQVAFLKAALGA